MVGNVTDESDQLAVDEDRLGVVDVGQVSAAGRMRIVGNEHIALVNVVAEFLEHTSHETAHRCDMDGQGQCCLDDQPAISVDDGDGVVLCVP